MTQDVVKEVDVAVIGTGFGGIYSLYKFGVEMGLSVQGFDDAGGVGGTWYWNRYPGARSDTEVTAYCYSFDKDLFRDWKWSMRYPDHWEIRDYLNTVADKYDLKKLVKFNTRIVAMEWDDDLSRWTLTTDAGEKYRAQFVVEGVGLLSATNFPKIQGQDSFKGELYHTARWPHEPVDLTGKRIAVIGTGSSGVQVVGAVAPVAAETYVFQRRPQFIVPAANRPIDEEHRQWILDNWEEYWHSVLWSVTAFGFPESPVAAVDATPEEREAVFDDAWKQGNGFRFMFATFGDIGVNPDSNKIATDYLERKMREIVTDQAIADKLVPDEYWARRPLCSDGYLEMFNRDNVHLIDVNETPVVEITEKGIRTTAGEIELDVIVLATGFDGVSGQYLKIDQTGQHGRRLSQHWADRPKTTLGLMVSGFPNMFMVYGPMGPFTNQPPAHEAQVNWMADVVKFVRDNNLEYLVPNDESEANWMVTCDDIAYQTLFMKVNSWINGSNVEGKPVTNYFYMGGMGAYMDIILDIRDRGFPGFESGRALAPA